MIKILIADDSSFMRNWLKEILQQHGYTNFIEASNGVEAIIKYMEFKPDIVFLDITMPKIDGLTVLKKLMEYDRDAKVVICSSLSTESNVRKALIIGAKGFVIKPNFNEISNILERILSAKDK